jgi:LytS/YehU family sensor histidine kinase
MVGCLLAVALYNLIYARLLVGHPSLMDGTIYEFWPTVKKLAIWYTVGHVIMYWTIVVAHDGWRYYRRYREREKRAVELQAQLTQARLDALRMQLNPHFLFNSLNTITALVHENPEAADRMITRLSELLRTSLDRAETHEIPLSQEFAFLARYLEIEQARFGERLKVEFAPGAGTPDALVPALILQPLVENAVRHGVEARDANARIRISARQLGDSMELSVADNGPGLANGGAVPEREGIGLTNTRSRLQHLYGDRQVLELRPRPEGGLEVIVRVPYRVNGTPGPTAAV